LSATVGFAVVDQHTPREVTVELPPEVTSPPDSAVVWVIPNIAAVVTVGGVGVTVVENGKSSP
jgi:hypothetical protein